ncbi:hypothetical protein [Janthinobacterium sp.]|uniref:hypothetical protein n=1 Tax=Janthinobacterium sp. TaxID=1871054 RepID=UPI00258DA6E5|nr:hypothetical protein [Janthinobacterium sp.]MCX7292478.1 hypothetical protein [Janthinobacterium sp.]
MKDSSFGLLRKLARTPSRVARAAAMKTAAVTAMAADEEHQQDQADEQAQQRQHGQRQLRQEAQRLFFHFHGRQGQTGLDDGGEGRCDLGDMVHDSHMLPFASGDGLGRRYSVGMN